MVPVQAAPILLHCGARFAAGRHLQTSVRGGSGTCSWAACDPAMASTAFRPPLDLLQLGGSSASLSSPI